MTTFIESTISRQFDKLPPHSIDAEMCLIGSLLLLDGDKAAFAETTSLVGHNSFYLADHQILFDSVMEMQKSGASIDAITIREHLRRQGLYEEIGGDAYFGQILNKVPSYAHYAHYARIVAGKAKWRELIALSNDALRSAYAPNNAIDEIDGADEALAKFSTQAAHIAAGGKAAAVYHVRDILPEILAMRETGNATIHRTGIAGLDAELGGLGFGQKHIVGALQSMGKSAFLKKLARNLAGDGIPVGLISIEEGRQKIVANLLSGESGVYNSRIRSATASPEEWGEIESAAARLTDLPIHLVDSARTLSGIVSMSHLLAAKYGCRAIFVDHDHIIDGQKEKGASREQEISKISAELKWAWRELNVIGVEAAQLNRSSGKDRPTMAHLRDSGTLAQDADVVMLLHREDYHHKGEANYTRTNILEVIIEKQKDGSTGTVPLWYDESRFLICDQENGKPIWPNNRMAAQSPIDEELLSGVFQ